MSTPLDTAYNRLDEAHRAWHTALNGYHRIEDFRAGINTAIQALRNLTFALQKQKDSLPDFDTWYGSWQEKMRDNPLLKELHEARSIIVKQEDLKLYSVGTARTKGWVDFQKMTFTFDPTSDSYDVAKGFYDTYVIHLPIAEEVKQRLIFEFERKWIYNKLPNDELLDAIAQAYRFFSAMLKDAEIKFSISPRENKSTGDYCSAELNDDEQLRCMILTPQERCLSFSFKDGGILTIQTGSISRSEADLRKVHDRYGDFWESEDILSLLEGTFPDEYPFDEMKLFAQVALSNLKRDGHLIPTSFIFNEKGTAPMIISHPFQNQESKVMVIDKVASAIIKNKAKFVLMVAELWQYKIDGSRKNIPTENDTRGTKDLFQASCVSADKLKIITIPFRKNIFGKVIFSKTEVTDYLTTEEHHKYILMPLINALQQNSKQSFSE
ncbi:MAG: hypothetical protein RL641_445 [Candidatus Parcubacteria bacterium]|jgi:hypothetical protein